MKNSNISIKDKIASFKEKINKANTRIQNRISPYIPDQKFESPEAALELIKSKIKSRSPSSGKISHP